MSTIFISHSTQDKTIAVHVLERLRKQGYETLFLDSDPEAGIKAGRDWERELYRNLKLAAAVVVLCSPDSMASRWCFAEITQAKALGKALFPVVIRPCEVVGSLTDRQVIDMAGRGEEEGFRRLFDGLRAAGLDPADSFGWDQRRPPFPGFLYFDQEDAGIYFGREAEVRQVIEKLTQMRRQGEPRLLVVVGSSGSGKSSLVRAGVLPRLGKDPSRWAVIEPFRPGTEPVGELARSLSLAFPDGPARPAWKDIRERLRDEARMANPDADVNGTLVKSALSDYGDDLTMALGRREASVLIVVDQAEELLQGVAPEESAAFLTVLRHATARPGGRVFGLLTLRSDFLGSFQNHAALRGVVFADIPLGPLPVENFPQVIEGPAARAEIALEPGLVPSLIADARTDDALPLLAFTLREMYERCRDRAEFTIKVYRDDLGGIKGAVARVVERIKSENEWTPETSLALQRAFLKLTRVNDEGQFTRQSARWADLPDKVAPVLEEFVKARLLTSNGDTVEVTHESLFRVWPELAGWLDEGRELMLWKRNIQDQVNDWSNHDRSPRYLLSGARVAEARRWLASSADEFTGPSAEFITASVAAEDDAIARDRAQEEKLRRLNRNLKVGVRVASVLAVIAIVAGGYAFLAKTEAEAQARIATSRQLAAYSSLERNKRLDRSLLLAVEAFRTERTFEARDSLFSALQDRPRATTFFHTTEGDVRSVAFSPDGRTIAAGVGGIGYGGVVLWDVTTRKRLAEYPLSANECDVRSVAFSPDRKTIAAGYERGARGGVVLWDVAVRKRLVNDPLLVNEGNVTSVAFSPDGKTIAAGYSAVLGSGGGGVVLWDVAVRKRLVNEPLLVNEGFVFSVAFSPDGKTIAAGYGPVNGGVVLWDSVARKRLIDEPLLVKEGSVRSVAFSPDGETIAAGYHVGLTGGVMLWDVAARKRLVDEPLSVKEGFVSSVAFSSDGMTIAAGYVGIASGGGVVLWDVAARKRLIDEPLLVHEGNVQCIAFSPISKTIAAGYSTVNGGVVLWDVAAHNRLVDGLIPLNEGQVSSVAFSPDGRAIAAGYVNGASGGGVVLCDAAARDRLVDGPLSVNEGEVSSVAFSPDGKTIAAGYGSGGVVLWDVAARKRLVDAPLSVKEGGVRSVAFSPDGKTLAAGGDSVFSEGGGGLVLWDVAARKRVIEEPLPVNQGEVFSVAFSPDGKTLAAGYGAEVGVGGVVLWDVAARKRVTEEPLLVNEGEVSSVAFSPDGKTIAAGYRSGGVVLWDVAARKRSVDEPLPVSEGYVSSVTFSPDGKTIAAGYASVSGSGGVVLWNVVERGRLFDQPLFVKGGNVESVAFSLDGKTIAAGCIFSRSGGAVVLLHFDLESWPRIAGRVANRNFTRNEWRRYFPDEPYRATFLELPVPPEMSRNHANSPAASPK